MEHRNRDHTDVLRRKRIRGVAHLAALVAVTSLCVLWAWNTIAAATFGAPTMRFSDALALAASAATLAMTITRAVAFAASRASDGASPP